jgi:polar amino acid transport system substrate-binding protein
MNRLLCELVLSLGILTATTGVTWAQDPSACSPETVKGKFPTIAGKTVSVALDGEQRPFTYHDPKDLNKVIGVDIDLMTATFKCLGLAWKIKIGTWSGLITSVAEGRNDVMWDTLNYTPARAQQVNFALYLSAATGFLVAKGNPKHVTSLESICGLDAAAGLGTVEEAAFHDLGKHCVSEGKSGISLQTYTDPTQGYRGIINGRIDVVMTDLAQSRVVVSDQAGLELAFHILSGFHVGVAVNKGETDLLSAIAYGLKVQQDNGLEKKTLEKFQVDPSLEYPVEIKTQ